MGPLEPLCIVPSLHSLVSDRVGWCPAGRTCWKSDQGILLEIPLLGQGLANYSAKATREIFEALEATQPSSAAELGALPAQAAGGAGTARLQWDLTNTPGAALGVAWGPSVPATARGVRNCSQGEVSGGRALKQQPGGVRWVLGEGLAPQSPAPLQDLSTQEAVHAAGITDVSSGFCKKQTPLGFSYLRTYSIFTYIIHLSLGAYVYQNYQYIFWNGPFLFSAFILKCIFFLSQLWLYSFLNVVLPGYCQTMSTITSRNKWGFYPLHSILLHSFNFLSLPGLQIVELPSLMLIQLQSSLWKYIC